MKQPGLSIDNGFLRSVEPRGYYRQFTRRGFKNDRCKTLTITRQAYNVGRRQVTLRRFSIAK